MRCNLMGRPPIFMSRISGNRHQEHEGMSLVMSLLYSARYEPLDAFREGKNATRAVGS